MELKTVLLDLDGTILDFDKSAHVAMEKVLTGHGLPYSEQLYNEYEEINLELWHEHEQGFIGIDKILDERFRRFLEKEEFAGDGREFEEQYQYYLANGGETPDGALEIVEYLSGKYDLYVVSNGVTKTQLNRLKISGLDKYMTDIFISEAVGANKPLREFFDFCFRHIRRFDRHRTMIVGDNLSSDIIGGYKAGIKTCWVNCDNRENSLLVPINYVIKDIRELVNIL